jgi:endonuclease/exonuclease/phosphatase family metal-dependent hydrolase
MTTRKALVQYAAVLIRSWNVYHGNSKPPQAVSYLEEMVRLAVADGPDVLFLQELPAWSLPRLGGWSGMTAIADVAQRPRLGPVPISAGFGRALTVPHHGFFRSAFAGQGNAILLAPGLRALSHEACVLNPAPFRREQSRLLGLDLVARLAWEKERRIVQIVRVEPRLVLANLHATSSGDRRLPAAEVGRAAALVVERTTDGDVVVIGGDFNVSLALAGFSPPDPGIDQILVRGAEPSPLRVWPDKRRQRGGMLLSDHAPVELDL